MGGTTAWQDVFEENMERIHTVRVDTEEVLELMQDLEIYMKLLQPDRFPLPQPIWCRKCKGRYDEAMRKMDEGILHGDELHMEYGWDAYSRAIPDSDGDPIKAFVLQIEWVHKGLCLVCGNPPQTEGE